MHMGKVAELLVTGFPDWSLVYVVGTWCCAGEKCTVLNIHALRGLKYLTCETEVMDFNIYH